MVENICNSPVDEKTFKYFYELASQIYASRRFLHDLLVAGDVTIVTVTINAPYS